MNEKNKKEIILHVGLPKTGTSYLQFKLFPSFKNVFVSGQGDPVVHESPLAPLMNLNFKNYDLLDEKEKILNYLNSLNFDKVLFSSESLVGNSVLNFKNNFEITTKLKTLFPDAKIFFVFRKQSDWLESLYNQHISKEKKYVKINDYLRFKDNIFTKGKYLNVYAFNWLNIYQNYVNVFGKENVLALPYEMMRKDFNLFLSTFYDFSGIEPYYPDTVEDINPKMDEIVIINLLLEFYLNLIDNLKNNNIKKIVLKNDRGFKNFLSFIKLFDRKMDYSKEKLTQEQKNKILNIHESSNKKLSEEIEIDLRYYGYY